MGKVGKKEGPERVTGEKYRHLKICNPIVTAMTNKRKHRKGCFTAET